MRDTEGPEAAWTPPVMGDQFLQDSLSFCRAELDLGFILKITQQSQELSSGCAIIAPTSTEDGNGCY